MIKQQNKHATISARRLEQVALLAVKPFEAEGMVVDLRRAEQREASALLILREN